MAKSPEKAGGAFRTIREVADWLGVPTHVLRFWESKFEQIAPVKGAGGRRYYRPEDMRLLGGIKVMLHDEGLTIRAVAQRIDEEGLEPIMALSPELDTADGPPARTRRVIRQGEEGKPGKKGAGKAEEPPAAAPSSGPVEIAKDPASDLSETLPHQPTDEETPLPSAPAPARDLQQAPGPEPRPVDAIVPGEPSTPAPDAPSDPEHQVRHAPDPDTDPEPEAAPPPEPAPPEVAAPAPEAEPQSEPTMPPLARARALAQAAMPPSGGDRKRLRRLVRRYRALADEIAEDLSEGAGR